MLTIVRGAIEVRLYSIARDARVACKHGTYHETFEVHCQMVLQIREVFHGPIVLNIPVTPVPSTLEAEFREGFVEDMHCSFSLRAFAVPSIR